MIIVWVNKRNWKTPGPIVNMAVHNAAGFADLGLETHLCVGAGRPSRTRRDLMLFYGISPQPRFTVHRIPRCRIRQSTLSISVFFYAYRLIQNLSRRDEVFVFSRDSGFLFFMSRLAKNPRIKAFFELHDLYADISWVKNKKGGHYRERIYEHLLLPRVNGIVCITRAQEKIYNRIFPHIPSCASPLGTEPAAAPDAAEARRQRRTLMYVGHMHGDKGVDFLLGAMQKLAKSGVRLIFWGGKPEKIPALAMRAADLGIASHVSFTPFRPPREMHRALGTEASLGVVMLRDTFYNRYLTCPVKALDYLSHGIPAIGSDLPSVREVLQDAGIYVPSDRADVFADAVLSLLDDPERYARCAERTCRRAREISWQMRAKRLMAFAGSCPAADRPGKGIRRVPLWVR